MFKMQILTQTDNHNSEEYVFTDEKYFLRKMSLKFGNSKFKILCNIALYFLLKNVNHLELRGQWGHSGTSSKRFMLQFLKKLKLYNKLVPETYTKYSNQNLFVIICLYYLSFASFIWNQPQKYFLQLEHYIVVLYWFICKIYIRSNFIWK